MRDVEQTPAQVPFNTNNVRTMNLKRAGIITLLSAAAIMTTAGNGDKKVNIINELAVETNGATVKVRQDARLDSMLCRHGSYTGERTVPGFRIQIYSNNTQKRAKEEAQQRAATINAYDEELTAYITFNSPFWRVRVGDFLNYEDAVAKLRELKAAFPRYEDMRIVKDNIIEKF